MPSRFRRSVTPWLLAVAVTAAACSGGSSKPRAATTTTAKAGTTGQSIKTGPPFYDDLFKDKSKGWPEANTDSVSYALAAKAYSITLKQAKKEADPHPEFRNVTQAQLTDYAVQAYLQTTPNLTVNDSFGVTCRDLNGKRYSFLVNRNADPSVPVGWSIWKEDGTGPKRLAQGTLKIGGSAYIVEGACVGGKTGPAHLAMAIDGKPVGAISDSTSPLTEGFAGVSLYYDGGQGATKASINVLHFTTLSATLV
jgi:hypothetical protein